MAIRAVLFDIGGVLEVNPSTGWPARWAERLSMSPETFERCVSPIGEPGAVGRLSLEEIEVATGLALGVDRQTVSDMMDDVWDEYLGALNVELARYLAALRPRYRTGMLSNSFVGAREREQDRHQLGDLATSSFTPTRSAI